MNPSPRATAVRLLIWCLLFGWAVWKMRSSDDVATGASMALSPEVRVLERPSDVPVPTASSNPTGPPAFVDPEALQTGLEAAASAAKACGVHGTVLVVTVGGSGLQRVELQGQVPDAEAACLGRAVWQGRWPAGAGEMEAQIEL